MIEYKAVSLANQIYDELEKRILSGAYAPGEIITEKRLVEELKVSRTPIREALGRLEQEHLIKNVPGGNEVIGVSKKDARDLFEIKLRVEGLVARLAAENITEEMLDDMTLIVDKQEFYAQKRDFKTVINLDNEFHEVIYKASGSIMYDCVMSGVHHKLFKYRMNSIEKENRIDASVAEHRAVLEAMKAGDANKTEEIMLKHLRNACDNLVGEVE